MTLVEVMFVVAILVVVVAGIMSANFLGWREENLLETKAGADDAARRGVSQLQYDIRAAKGYDICSVVPPGTNYNIITNGNYQGTGLMLYSYAISTNQIIDTNQYILYFFDTTQSTNQNGMLWRLQQPGGTATLVVSNLINTLYFTSEDYQGYTQAVRTYKGVIHTTLQFSQFLYPRVPIGGSNALFDCFRIDSRATPHIPDGP